MTRTRGLRVIAGSARGRRLVAPAGDTVRPTKDMTREAVFSALDARGAIGDAAVLDLFAGTGAYAIEALSRGAGRAVLVERDRGALGAIAENLERVGFAGLARVAHADVVRFLAGPVAREAPFDVVFADPPYDTPDDAVTRVCGALLAPGWLADDVIVVVERPVKHDVIPPAGLVNRWERTFGDTLVTFLEPTPAGHAPSGTSPATS
jgi:16S rRNA (guanine966-N2)-methyltransferase